MQCHYCGYSKPLDNICPECHSDSVRYSGYGTQRIEDEISSLFPNARILRMDADTTTAKFSHKRLLDSFATGEYDILIGTQMVAKGLDFENVTLVGVVNADNSLYDESYTANEKHSTLLRRLSAEPAEEALKAPQLFKQSIRLTKRLNMRASRITKAFIQTKFSFANL